MKQHSEFNFCNMKHFRVKENIQQKNKMILFSLRFKCIVDVVYNFY